MSKQPLRELLLLLDRTDPELPQLHELPLLMQGTRRLALTSSVV
jgi:hypothetical protein